MLVKRPWKVEVRSLALAERWRNVEHMEHLQGLDAGEGAELGTLDKSGWVWRGWNLLSGARAHLKPVETKALLQ